MIAIFDKPKEAEPTLLISHGEKVHKLSWKTKCKECKRINEEFRRMKKVLEKK